MSTYHFKSKIIFATEKINEGKNKSYDLTKVQFDKYEYITKNICMKNYNSKFARCGCKIRNFLSKNLNLYL